MEKKALCVYVVLCRHFFLVTEGKAKVQITKMMVAEFHLAATVSASCFHTCRLTALASWDTCIEQNQHSCLEEHLCFSHHDKSIYLLR